MRQQTDDSVGRWACQFSSRSNFCIGRVGDRSDEGADLVRTISRRYGTLLCAVFVLVSGGTTSADDPAAVDSPRLPPVKQRTGFACRFLNDQLQDRRMVDGQAKGDESGQDQVDQPSLISGGSLRMISPVSDTFK